MRSGSEPTIYFDAKISEHLETTLDTRTDSVFCEYYLVLTKSKQWKVRKVTGQEYRKMTRYCTECHKELQCLSPSDG